MCLSSKLQFTYGMYVPEGLQCVCLVNYNSRIDVCSRRFTMCLSNKLQLTYSMYVPEGLQCACLVNYNSRTTCMFPKVYNVLV